MPPEPFPWDRKEFFRDRKHAHDRSDNFGPVVRWRDSSSSSFNGGGGGGGSHRGNNWAFSSDFRRPLGHGKQGGWHMYHEDSPHGYPTGRSGDRFLDDDGFRPSIPRGDGRYGRFYRENRASFGQKEWRCHWEPNHHRNIMPNGPSRPHFLNDQRSVGDSPMRASHPHSDPSDKFHSKDQSDKTSDVNGLGTGEKLDKENSLGSHEWKPLKWSRSGSLTSRGSGYSHSSGSKSNGGESNDLKRVLSPKNVSPIQSPSGEAVACTPSVNPSEETSSRKKQRLGWGEGLAKYEKKKVEGPEENVSQVENEASLYNVESTNTPTTNLVDKSPRLPGLSNCSSPATPSSFACSSSPGLEDKAYAKTTDADANNCSDSSMPPSENQLEGLHFSLEKLELNSISNLSSLLTELLQASDQYPMDSAFVKSSASNKLLLWKGDVSKELECTETEIDSLENELKSLNSVSRINNNAFRTSLDSLFADCEDEPRDKVSMIPRPPPLEVVSPEDMVVVEKLPLPCDNARRAHIEDKDEDIDSPGSATSKFVEPLTTQKSLTAEWTNCRSKGTDFDVSAINVTQNLDVNNDTQKTAVSSCQGDNDQGSCHPKDDNIYDAIFDSNKESAARAVEVFSKLLPSGDSCVVKEAKRAPCLVADSTVREKFLRRKKFAKFKEKVIALKYRAFHRLWKEDLCLLSSKSQKMKLQKKNDLSSRIIIKGGIQKHRSSIRSRISSPARSLSQVLTSDIIKFTGKLLSDSPAKIYRSSLKMPAMILDEKEKKLSRFVSHNGFVEDPCLMEKEKALINPWTAEEKEIFLKQLAILGKDFCKIATFLDHKTTADCIEFYYKNHKSDWFGKTKKKPELKAPGILLSSNTYLMTSGNKWSRGMNAASLDILGEASVIASQADEANKKSKGSGAVFEASSSDHNTTEDEREVAAADVLAGICGSISSEAMSSCITSAVDPQFVGSSMRRPLTPEVTQNVDGDDTCSDESCGEMDPIDWTDDEKSLFVQAFASYRKDFVMISRFVRTKSRDQCKVFFSKARKCLGLDNAHPETVDGDDACIVDEDLTHINEDVSKPEALITEQLDHKEDDADTGDDHLAKTLQVDLADEVADDPEIKSNAGIPRGEDQLITEDDEINVEFSVGEIALNIAKLENEANASSSSSIDIRVSGDRCSQLGDFVINQGESSQILTSVPMESPIASGRSFQNCYMRKCSQTPSRDVVGELPFLVKSVKHAGTSCSSKTTEKPIRNGDVKLFGKILSKPSSDDKPTTSSSSKFDINLAANHDMDENSFLGLENVPIRSYGYWDGTKIQTGFSSLPDSAFLLAKYPAAFSNYPARVNVDECNVNNACLFSPRESSISSGSIMEYPINPNPEGAVLPFSLEEMPRNGFEAISSLRQQGNGLVKLNVVQGGISDPVTALKLHYARAHKYGGGEM